MSLKQRSPSSFLVVFEIYTEKPRNLVVKKLFASTKKYTIHSSDEFLIYNRFEIIEIFITLKLNTTRKQALSAMFLS